MPTPLGAGERVADRIKAGSGSPRRSLSGSPARRERRGSEVVPNRAWQCAGERRLWSKTAAKRCLAVPPGCGGDELAIMGFRP